MRKIFLVIFLFSLILTFVPRLTQAAGLVPCGGPGEPACQLCHIFVMLDRIIDSILIQIVPSLAALMIAVGGFMYIIAYVGGGEPEMLSRAKRLFTSVAFGLLIIYGAFLIIGTFFWFIGLADWTEEIYRNWWREGFFEIPCS